MTPSRLSRRGIALVLIAGLLTLLAVAGAGMAAFAVQLRTRTGIEIDRVSARLLARSGMEFATARLGEDSWPKEPASRDNQPDDWVFRDDPSTPLERALNPSYAQTEPYQDSPIPGERGRYTVQTDTYTDLNANGRFDAWSGRLRGAHGPSGGTFTLKIESSQSRLCVNDGCLDTSIRESGEPGYRDLGAPMLFFDYPFGGVATRTDYWGDSNGPATSGFSIGCWGWDQARYGPPYLGIAPAATVNDTFCPHGAARRNRRLAEVINDVARICGISQPPWVGDLVVQRRPPGGYADDRALAAAIGPAVWERIGAYLSTAQSGRLAFPPRCQYPIYVDPLDPAGEPSYYLLNNALPPNNWKRHTLAESAIGGRLSSPELRTPVQLSTAAAPLLAALAEGTWAFGVGGGLKPATVTSAGFVAPASQTAVPTTRVYAGYKETDPPHETIQDTEAAALAQALTAGPRPRFSSWQEFFRWLDARKAVLFSGTPHQLNLKVNALELSWNPDPLPVAPGGQGVSLPFSTGPVYPPPETGHYAYPASEIPSASWFSFDLDRGEPHADGDGRLQRFGAWWEWRRLAPERAAAFQPAEPSSVPPDGVYAPWGSCEVALDPPGSFRVESFGRSSRSLDRLLATAGASRLLRGRDQSDFETGIGTEPGPGIRVAEGRIKDRLQTWPMFPLDSCPDSTGCNASLWRYPQGAGMLLLMDRSRGWSGDPGETFCQPNWEIGQPERSPRAPSRTWDNFVDVSPRGAIPTYYPSLLLPSLRQGTVPWMMRGGVGTGPVEGEFHPGMAFTRFEWFAPGTMPSMSPQDRARERNDLKSVKPPMGDSGTLEWIQITPYGFGYAGPTDSGKHHQITVIPTPPAGVATGIEDQAQMVWYSGNLPASQGPEATLQTLRVVPVPEPHPVAFTFGEDGVHAYVDGIHDTALPDYQPDAALPGDFGILQCGGLDELRINLKEKSPVLLVAAAAQPRYWLPDDGGAGVPAYLSPRYVFRHPVSLVNASWEGFVPKVIREGLAQEAQDAAPEATPPFLVSPLQVDLLLYEDSGARGAPIVVPISGDSWAAGGARLDFAKLWRTLRPGAAAPRVSSLRYRIRMDASAVTGLPNETPVFRSISIGFRGGACALSDWSQE